MTLREASSVGRLCQLAIRLADSSAVNGVCSALERGELRPESTAAIRFTLAGGVAQVEGIIREVQTLWESAFSSLSGEAIALALRSAAGGVQLERGASPRTQIVWTGPRVDGSYLRATREVVREIVCGAKKELLIVGYWLAARDDGEGVIEELIELLSSAVRRNVDVVAALDGRERTTGSSNKTVLLEVWPSATPLPRLLTWKLPLSDRYLKLHAKVIVSDSRDALITSANLTGYAMDRNIEMGIRVVGEPARRVRDHFSLLEAQGVLEPF
jgi:hypothetical protein